MFNFFKRNKPAAKVKDLIWLTEETKLNAIVKEYKNSNAIIAVWFDSTYRKLESLLAANGLASGKIYMARELASHSLKYDTLLFAEHYPLANKEEELFDKLHLSEVIIYSSLDEPLFTYFGGDGIIDMVKQLGMKENEALQNKFITSSIRNAQKKIAGKITTEQTANSSSDWFLYNLGKHSL